MDNIIDIETIPDQTKGADDYINEVKVPANYKKLESILAYQQEHAEETWAKTALSPNYGQIYCIAWMIPEISMDVRWIEGENEKAMLLDFAEHLREMKPAMPTWIGHNVVFDLGFIAKRAMIHRIKLPFVLPFTKPPWSGAYIDTMYQWCGAKEKISLNKLCEILGVEIKDEIDGSQVWDAIQSGNEQQVIDHCCEDVRKVYQIDQIMRGNW